MIHGPAVGRAAAALALAVASIALSSTAQEASSAGGAARESACRIPHQHLLRTWRGWTADRGPEIQIIAREPNFVGSGLPHVGPWDYVQRVPMFWYGPGIVPEVGPVARPVTSAGIASTQAQLLDEPFRAIDGQPMREALPRGEASATPKLVVVLVWDAAGMNVLEEHPRDWPFLRSLIPQGVWYENATVGSSPTSTAQIHATIGTGAFPRTHGLVGHRLRIGPNITTPWVRGPALMNLPTFADVYDRNNANAPLVAMMGTVAIHAGMLGHGRMWGGGDKDIALFRQALESRTLGEETFEWNLPADLQPFYSFPGYANKVPGFQALVDQLDRADGKFDEKWRSNEIAPLLQGFDTPARTPYQEIVIEDIIRREGFGRDEVPDLLYINHKIIDFISHVQTMNSPEMSDAVKAEDAALRRFVDFLNEQVGAGQWVLVLTSDHGAIPDPDTSGAFQISTAAIAAGINARFDQDGDDVAVLQQVQPTGIFIDTDELRDNGHSLLDVAGWILSLTESEAVAPGVAVPGGEGDEPVFAAAFPSEIMDHLPCLPEARR